jgi:hypothetical protein
LQTKEEKGMQNINKGKPNEDLIGGYFKNGSKDMQRESG